ncbi:hypothetical protein ACQKK5_23845 [Brevibacillus panacihumi]|uniref:hypothetical protein n=1 Tax=Brevibacillus panacihumi TaxID=497735 RepID=UPI003D05CFF2
MKKWFITLSVVAVLSVGTISYSIARNEMDDFEKGTEFAKIYQQAVDNFSKKNLTRNDLSGDITKEEIVDKIAQYKAAASVFGAEVTEQQALEKITERKLLADYARENDLYPSEKDIEKKIEKHINDYKEYGSELLDGMIEELDISAEEFFYDFSRPGYEEELVRINIIEQLKSENEKDENETEQEYHNRMIKELENLISELK